MSTRTIVEINHDFADRLERSPGPFMRVLGEWLRGATPEAKALLEHYGVRVVWSGHHSMQREVNTEHETIEL